MSLAAQKILFITTCLLLVVIYVAINLLLVMAFLMLFIIEPILSRLYPKWKAENPRPLKTNKILTKTAPKGKLKEVKKDLKNGKRKSRDKK